jgi:hypothetical protein
MYHTHEGTKTTIINTPAAIAASPTIFLTWNLFLKTSSSQPLPEPVRSRHVYPKLRRTKAPLYYGIQGAIMLTQNFLCLF